MKLYKFIIITFLSFIFTTICEAQGEKTALRKANKEYRKFAYIKTTKILLKVANKGYKNEEMFRKLGNSFYFNNKMKDAARWYGELMAMNENVDDPEYYFRYALALKSIKNYEQSDVWMAKFHASKQSDLRGRAFESTKDYLSKIELLTTDLKVHNLNFNSEYSDFGTTQYKNQLIFASSKGGDKKHLWNGNEQPYLNLYVATKNNRSTYDNIKAYNQTINTKYHESTPSFTPDNKIMFFTRNNFYNKKYQSDTEGINKLKIFRSKLDDDDEWGELESIHFNSNNYSVAHPAVNHDGTKIYFASDMPGTTGQSDIYVANLNANGTLDIPVNLGTALNTEGQDTFPFINSKGDLFYSSNGFPGLGGLDIFVIRDFERKYEKNKPLVAVNLGKPINSAHDDFAYYENLKTQDGFFSSNRPGGKGDDDIYSFEALDPRKCKQVIEGFVKDTTTNELLPNSTVTLFNSNGKQINSKLVGEDAAFRFELNCGEEYIVRGEKTKYYSDEKRILAPKIDFRLSLGKKLGLNLDSEIDPFNVGDDIKNLLGIKIIYFDFDKAVIRRPDAAIELQKIIEFMNSYPTVNIDVQSHTDSRSSQAYNDDLSSRRNKSTIDYMVNVGGIDRGRLTGRGYGERELVNECADGIHCSEYKHDLNRRSVFIVTKK